jgi:glycolate oxidase iron-sulfur subunit
MMNIRQYITDQKDSPGVKYRVMGIALKDRNIRKMSSTALGLINKLRLNRLVPFGMAPRWFTREDYLKKFGGPAALKGNVLPSQITLDKNMKIAYFKGCGMEMFFPEAAADTIKVLNSITEVQLVDNVCCGLPHISHGLRRDFFELAKKNIRLYQDADIVISDCASCSSTLGSKGTSETSEKLVFFSGLLKKNIENQNSH